MVRNGSLESAADEMVAAVVSWRDRMISDPAREAKARDEVMEAFRRVMRLLRGRMRPAAA